MEPTIIELKRQYPWLGDMQAGVETRKLVRRSARKGKEAHLVRSFEKAQRIEDPWKSIRSARKKFVPRFVRFKNRHGEYSDFSQKAPATVDYLANVQWSCRSLVLRKLTLDPSFLIIFILMTLNSLFLSVVVF